MKNLESLKNIPYFDKFNRVEIKEFNEGTIDKKYIVETDDGEKFFLRVAEKRKFKRKKIGFEIMQNLVKLGIPMPYPIELGKHGESVYLIQSWASGKTY